MGLESICRVCYDRENKFYRDKLLCEEVCEGNLTNLGDKSLQGYRGYNPFDTNLPPLLPEG